MDERRSAPPAQTYELSGGALCLDFANTWADRARPEKEYLHGYADLLAFAVQAGVVGGKRARELAGKAQAAPAEAAAAFESARGLREAIYRMFSAVAVGEAPPERDLERLNAALPDALAGARIERCGPAFAWAWGGTEDPLEDPLRPIVRSAAELLTSGRLDRIRECDGRACTWLFFDQSRNRSKRWCSMETCGNRAKVRRHYRRRRSGR